MKKHSITALSYGCPFAEYNAKQKRKNRIIKDYYDHIFHSKQGKPFYELIIQVGNKDDTPCNSDDGKLAAQILIEFEKEFQKRNPHIRVFNSVLHMDEHTPHLHIDFVPFATNQKRGLSTRNALTKVLEQQGFIAKNKFDTSSKLWIDSEKECLSEIMQRYGIKLKKLGTHNNHLWISKLCGKLPAASVYAGGWRTGACKSGAFCKKKC